MAKAQKGMRRKNRQVKMTLSIPDEYKSEDDFMYALQETMDDTNWSLALERDETGAGVEVDVSKMQLGDIEIGPEDEED